MTAARPAGSVSARIADVRVIRADIPVRRPHVMSFTTLRAVNFVFVRLTTDDGLVGWGEAACLGGPTWSEESAESVAATIERCASRRRKAERARLIDARLAAGRELLASWGAAIEQTLETRLPALESEIQVGEAARVAGEKDLEQTVREHERVLRHHRRYTDDRGPAALYGQHTRCIERPGRVAQAFKIARHAPKNLRSNRATALEKSRSADMASAARMSISSRLKFGETPAAMLN